MAQKIQRFTRKKLHRLRAQQLKDQREEQKLRAREEQDRERTGRFFDSQLKGCE